ncbi:hypothetical protein [Galbibacter sp.]|uniref:hypothetical protein n=1 Tax=Galbibacter sp. TaxID=2918471 RepID=UPI003A95A43B
MKKLFLGVILLATILGTYSCSNEDISDTESLYQHQANDDGATNGGDPDEPDGN